MHGLHMIVASGKQQLHGADPSPMHKHLWCVHPLQEFHKLGDYSRFDDFFNGRISFCNIEFVSHVESCRQVLRGKHSTAANGSAETSELTDAQQLSKFLRSLALYVHISTVDSLNHQRQLFQLRTYHVKVHIDSTKAKIPVGKHLL
eukprot:356110-Chlamydomonas_euryale.AAC.2